MDTRYFNLVGEYEEALEIPEEACTMNYWEKLDTHFIISEEYIDKARKLEDDALKVIGQTRESFEADERFASRKFIESEILKGLKANLEKNLDVEKHLEMDTRYIDLVAIFEDAMQIPPYQRTTEYFSDYDLYYIKGDRKLERAVELKKQMLDILGMTQEEFDKKPEFVYRSEIRKALTECMESYRNIYGCKDKRYLFEHLSRTELQTVENILKAYGGKIDLDIPRDTETEEIDFDGEFKLIVEDESYKEVGIEVTVLKWYESLEDTSYMIDVVQMEDCYLQNEMEQTADEMGGISM